MRKPTGRSLEEFVADPRDDAAALTSDQDIIETLDDSLNPPGLEDGTRKLRHREAEDCGLQPDVAARDPDVDPEYAATIGEEAVGGGNPTPDQAVVEDIGRAVGLEYQDSEPLHTTQKLERRDRDRWELAPASAEDFDTRRREW